MASKTSGRFTARPRRRRKGGKRARVKATSSPRARRRGRRIGRRHRAARGASFMKRGGFKFMGVDIGKGLVMGAAGGASLWAHGWAANQLAGQAFVPTQLKTGLGKTLGVRLPLTIATSIAAKRFLPADIFLAWMVAGFAGVGVETIVQTIRPQDQVGLSGHEPLEEQLGALVAENPNALNGLVAVNGDSPFTSSPITSSGYAL